METKEGLVTLAFLALLILTIIFGFRSASYNAELKAAREMSAQATSYLESQGVLRLHPECRGASQGAYEKLGECFAVAQNSNDLTLFFTRDDFANAAPATGREGHLVITNEKGGKTFESGSFTLYFNNELLVTGCTTPGEITPGYTCRFNFNESCDPGDNLEVKYDGERAFLYTC